MTKKTLIIFTILALISAFVLTAENTQKRSVKKTGNGTCIFIDENGDGINDNYRDHDGDGVPNFEDPDWKRPQDGKGYGNGNGKMNRGKNRRSSRGSSSRSGFQNGFGNSFQTQNSFGGNFGAGTCNGSGFSGGNGNGRGRRGNK